MEKIRGTNIGNWLVLEKWMSPGIFEGTGTEDETWLSRKLPQEELKARLKELSAWELLRITMCLWVHLIRLEMSRIIIRRIGTI